MLLQEQKLLSPVTIFMREVVVEHIVNYYILVCFFCYLNVYSTKDIHHGSKLLMCVCCKESGFSSDNYYMQTVRKLNNNNSCYRSWAHGQGLLCLQLRADEAKGSIQWKMTLYSCLCVKTTDNYDKIYYCYWKLHNEVCVGVTMWPIVPL